MAPAGDGTIRTVNTLVNNTFKGLGRNKHVEKLGESKKGLCKRKAKIEQIRCNTKIPPILPVNGGPPRGSKTGKAQERTQSVKKRDPGKKKMGLRRRRRKTDGTRVQ